MKSIPCKHSALLEISLARYLDSAHPISWYVKSIMRGVDTSGFNPRLSFSTNTCTCTGCRRVDSRMIQALVLFLYRIGVEYVGAYIEESPTV